MDNLPKSVAAKYLMPLDDDAVGVQNDGEQRLCELVMAGVNSGPSQLTMVAELIDELRAHIRAGL